MGDLIIVVDIQNDETVRCEFVQNSCMPKTQQWQKEKSYILHCDWQPKQVMCLVAYVSPQDKIIRLSPRPCFILDEFQKFLPGKFTACSQANTKHVSYIS